jgi:hypothetical protein
MKITASEFRIGNLVYFFKETPVMIIAISSEELYLTQGCGFINPKIDECEPIPLTEEWLLKLGFQKEKEHYTWYFKGKVIINVFNYIAYKLNANGYTRYESFKYVHQLQNLYFALTGEELTFKSE